MIIALASPCVASALDESLDKINRFLSEASAQGAEIVCFPEAYLSGLRGQDFEVPPLDQTQQERALEAQYRMQPTPFLWQFAAPASELQRSSSRGR